MFAQYATATGPANTVGIDLHTVWDVRADPSYAVDHTYSIATSRRLHPRGGIGLICIRTFAGLGRVRLLDGHTLDVAPDTLLLLGWEQLAAYACAAGAWDFWWFEFTVTGPLFVPLNTIVPVHPFPAETGLFRQACHLLRRAHYPERCLASAKVVELFYQWFASHKEALSPGPYRRAIECVIDQMHDRLNEPWSVPEMARVAHMSERNFRKIFRDVTGQPPKQFYNQLRLSFARQLLARRYNVAQTADALGFSSPYHLSREFKAFYGIAPSKVRLADQRRP